MVNPFVSNIDQVKKMENLSFAKWRLQNSVATYNQKKILDLRILLIWGDIFLYLNKITFI